MAFNRENPAHLATLKALVPDPNISTALILASLNDEINNPGAETGASPLIARDLLNIVLGASVSAGDQFKIQLLFEASSGLGADMSEFRLQIIVLSNALEAGILLLTRHLSIAEVNFSNVDVATGVQEFVTISRADWFAARDS